MIIDKIMKNAKVLGILSEYYDKYEYTPHLLSYEDEICVMRYTKLKREQEKLVEILRGENELS